jgi:hypothetical protein
MQPNRWFGAGSAEGADAGARAVAGALVWIMEGGERSVLEATDAACGDSLVATAPGVPVGGFYTYGEIARTRGIRGFHNQTLVVLSIA